MNDQSVLNIQKHCNKINRILNKICENNPQLSEEIDIALYSCLKIDKIIKKHLELNPIQKNNEKNVNFAKGNITQVQSEQDQLFQTALNIIEGFKSATKKLQNKVGVLLRQQQIHKKAQRFKNPRDFDPYYQLPKQQISSQNYTVNNNKKLRNIQTYETISSFSPNVIASSQSKKKSASHYISSDSKQKFSKEKELRIKRPTHHRNESQSFQQMPNDQSKNISELDQEIIDLASQIKHIIKGQ